MAVKTLRLHEKGSLAALILAAVLLGCAGTVPAPETARDLCSLFRDRDDWYIDAARASRRWQIPIPVLMAVIHQESRFDAKAKPPRTRCLFVLPGPRPSSAYGYAQALDTTWESYMRETDNWGADRDRFADAVDFVGWYCRLSCTRCGIAPSDAASLYLAYHEGQGGFNRRTHAGKGWLLRVATRVDRQAKAYAAQLSRCEAEFQDGGCCLWPF